MTARSPLRQLGSAPGCRATGLGGPAWPPPRQRPPDLAALHAFILGAQETAAAYARNYPGTVKEIRKALRVNDAFQQVLDDPAAADALQHAALKPLLDEAASY